MQAMYCLGVIRGIVAGVQHALRAHAVPSGMLDQATSSSSILRQEPCAAYMEVLTPDFVGSVVSALSHALNAVGPACLGGGDRHCLRLFVNDNSLWCIR